jgi:hypothetical protein
MNTSAPQNKEQQLKNKILTFSKHILLIHTDHSGHQLKDVLPIARSGSQWIGLNIKDLQRTDGGQGLQHGNGRHPIVGQVKLAEVRTGRGQNFKTPGDLVVSKGESRETGPVKPVQTG